MSKLIASTMTHRTFPLLEALQRLKDAGFDAAELCSVGAWIPHFLPSEQTDASVKETAARIADIGIRIHCINCAAYTLDEMKMIYALAQETGAKIVTTPCGRPGEGESPEAALVRMTAQNAALADLAIAHGVTPSVEAPHKKTIAENASQIDAYWAAQDTRVRCTFDTAHLTFAGDDPLPVAARYSKRIAHCHLRDAIKGNSLMRYGEGIVDFGKFIATVRAGGYDGYFSMEYPADSDEEAPVLLAKSVEYLSQFDF